MNPTVWITEFMIKDLRYQASLKKRGDYCMERAADRLEKLEKENNEARAEIDKLTAELLQARASKVKSEPPLFQRFTNCDCVFAFTELHKNGAKMVSRKSWGDSGRYEIDDEIILLYSDLVANDWEVWG